jgi:hypothetical protein
MTSGLGFDFKWESISFYFSARLRPAADPQILMDLGDDKQGLSLLLTSGGQLVLNFCDERGAALTVLGRITLDVPESEDYQDVWGGLVWQSETAPKLRLRIGDQRLEVTASGTSSAFDAPVSALHFFQRQGTVCDMPSVPTVAIAAGTIVDDNLGVHVWRGDVSPQVERPDAPGGYR